MDKQAELTKLNAHLSANQSQLQSLYRQNADYQQRYDSGMMAIQKLEQELAELRQHQQNIAFEQARLEELTSGEASPMATVQFVKIGQLESRALEKIQERIQSRRMTQQTTGQNIQEMIEQLEQQAQQIKREIEQQRAATLQLERLIATNEASIHSVKANIASTQSKLRAL
ncbi:Uncharacterised protein [Niallia circulans]|nr:Uncharacterised protein [Niallia circulans]